MDAAKQQNVVQFTNPSARRHHRDCLARNTTAWMANLPDQLKKMPIIHLAIPGSHDSGTWSISRHSDWAPDLDELLQKLKFLGGLVKWVTSRWSKAQDYNINNQLSAGVRYFDLRIATRVAKDGTRDFYIVHGLYGPSIKDVLYQFRDYLSAHPQEVIIIDCQHFYDLTPADHDQLAALIKEALHGKVVPSTSHYMQHLSLDYMHTNQYQAIVVYRHVNWSHYNFFPSNAYPTPWPDTTSPDKLVKILTSNLEKRNSNVGYVSQFILTPVAKTVVSNLFTGDLKKFSGMALCRKKLGWVKEQSPGSNGVNVIIADFVDIEDQEFCRCVINLNQKLLAASDPDALPPVTN